MPDWICTLSFFLSGLLLDTHFESAGSENRRGKAPSLPQVCLFILFQFSLFSLQTLHQFLCRIQSPAASYLPLDCTWLCHESAFRSAATSLRNSAKLIARTEPSCLILTNKLSLPLALMQAIMRPHLPGHDSEWEANML